MKPRGLTPRSIVGAIAPFAIGSLFLCARPAAAASATQSATVSVNVSSAAALLLSANTLTFADSTPNAAATPNPVNATEGNITVTAYVRTSSGSSSTLQVKASAANLTGTSGAGNTAVSIPVSRVAAATTSSSFKPVAAMSATNQSLDNGSWNSGIYTGTYTWSFQPQWTDASASYTGSFVYTLTAP